MDRTPPAAPRGTDGRSIGRRELLRLGAILGLALPVVACGRGGDRAGAGPDGRTVVVVGAGAAGLTAAHLLARAGVDVRVLEAGPSHGGRIRRTLDFVDFPIPLGAGWLHAEPDTLRGITGDDSVDVELAGYGPDATLGYYDGELALAPLGDVDDLTFVGSSWLDVFDEHVLPGIADRIRLDTRVVEIDASGDRVAVVDERGGVVHADAVVVTVPVTILRDRDITFVPDLSDERWAAIDGVDVWGGIKVFIEFDDRFYPTFVAFPDSDTDAGQRLYFDAAHAQRSEAHVLGLFAVGAPARPYQALAGDELRDHVLAELDEIFDGAASRTYRRHVVQDWSADPFARQAYVADGADWRLVRALGEPAGDRVLFAGDAYTDGSDWSSVHVAAASARAAVERLLATT
ncbi:MAG TPA: FAD-dependent oxidoreductase [Acidimicrobiales bacterium]|nr:FAD-dependent oxidoreductase [Acidimicrobiales bacterium]